MSYQLDDHNITDICGVASVLIVQIFTFLNNRSSVKKAACEVQKALVTQTAVQTRQFVAVEKKVDEAKVVAQSNGTALAEVKEAISTGGSVSGDTGSFRRS